MLAVLLTVRYALVPWQGRAREDAIYPYDNSILTDFRDTVLLPARALAQGVDPYNIEQYTQLFPHAQEFDPYMPWWLSLTSPLAHLSWGQMTLVWSMIMAVATSLCAYWAGRGVALALKERDTPLPRWIEQLAPSPVVWGLAFVCIQWLWRPTTVGQGLGNIGALAGLFALLALMGDDDRWNCAFLALAWVKPQFGIPLVIILLARGQWRRAVGGTSLAIVASLPMVVQVSMIEGGFGRLVAVVLDAVSHLGARSGGEPFEGRIDVARTIAAMGFNVGSILPMIVGAVVLVIAALAVRPLASSRPGMSLLLLTLGLLIGFPHLHYDLAMLCPVVLWAGVECLPVPQRGIDTRLDLSTLAVGLLFLTGFFPGTSLWSGVTHTTLQAALSQVAYVLLLFYVGLAARRRRRVAAAGELVRL